MAVQSIDVFFDSKYSRRQIYVLYTETILLYIFGYSVMLTLVVDRHSSGSTDKQHEKVNKKDILQQSSCIVSACFFNDGKSFDGSRKWVFLM